MVRTQGAGPHRKERHKKILKAARGYYGRASKSYRIAKQSVDRAGQYSFAHRRKRGNDFRSLWIQRMNAYLRSKGFVYSDFIGRYNKMVIDGKLPEMNRKTLSESAIRAPEVFDSIIKSVYQAK